MARRPLEATPAPFPRDGWLGPGDRHGESLGLVRVRERAIERGRISIVYEGEREVKRKGGGAGRGGGGGEEGGSTGGKGEGGGCRHLSHGGGGRHLSPGAAVSTQMVTRLLQSDRFCLVRDLHHLSWIAADKQKDHATRPAVPAGVYAAQVLLCTSVTETVVDTGAAGISISWSWANVCCPLPRPPSWRTLWSCLEAAQGSNS